MSGINNIQYCDISYKCTESSRGRTLELGRYLKIDKNIDVITSNLLGNYKTVSNYCQSVERLGRVDILTHCKLKYIKKIKFHKILFRIVGRICDIELENDLEHMRDDLHLVGGMCKAVLIGRSIYSRYRQDYRYKLLKAIKKSSVSLSTMHSVV